MSVCGQKEGSVGLTGENVAHQTRTRQPSAYFANIGVRLEDC
jgi:hypothetical protein